jgi:L-alanine-DL-glutamate epimerase-like enolase superfamily enzyme
MTILVFGVLRRSALSAVDIAVWDLRARRARLPLYRLLGAYRDQVPAYRSLDRMAAMTLQELVEAATADLTAVWRQHPRPGHRPPLSQP